MVPLDGLTLWPDLELPALPVRGIYELPEEFWMRELLDLDTSSVGAIIDFCAAWGLLWEGASSVPIKGLAWEIEKLQETARTLLAIARGEALGRHDISEARDEINKRLAEYPPIRVGLARKWKAEREPEGDWQTAVGVTLEVAICVQMHNFIYASPHVSKCQRTGCGREYVNQRGRNRFGGHRTSSYCTAACASAQAKHDYRVRERKKDLERKKKLAEEGGDN